MILKLRYFAYHLCDTNGTFEEREKKIQTDTLHFKIILFEIHNLMRSLAVTPYCTRA